MTERDEWSGIVEMSPRRRLWRNGVNWRFVPVLNGRPSPMRAERAWAGWCRTEVEALERGKEAGREFYSAAFVKRVGIEVPQVERNGRA